MASSKLTKEHKIIDGYLNHTVVMLHATEDDRSIVKAKVVTHRYEDVEQTVLINSCSTTYTANGNRIEAVRTYIEPDESDTTMDVIRAYSRPVWDAQDQALRDAFTSGFRSSVGQRLIDLQEVETINWKQ